MAKGNTTTVQPDGDVGALIAAVESEQKRADSATLLELMSRVTGEPPVMWGTIVGFGRYHYKYESGHEGDTCLVGFSPRKAALSICIHGAHYPDVVTRRDELLSTLGKHSMGKGCLYVKKLSDIDLNVLEGLAQLSVETLRRLYPA